MKKQRYLESEKLSLFLFIFLFLMYAVVYMTKNMFTSAMAVIVEDGVMTKSQTGLINAVFWLVYAPFQVIGGFAADKYSPYKLILIGLAGSVIANIIIFFNQSYYVMMGAWTFNAMIQFGVWPGVFKVVSTQLTHKMRSTAVFWMLFATSAGLGFSMLTASYVTDWRQNFIISAFSLLIMMLIYIVVNHYMNKKMVEEEVSYNKNIVNNNPDKHPMLPLMLKSGLLVFLFVSLMRVAIDNGIKMMTPVMLMETYENLPAAIATRLSTILILFSALGTFVSGLVKTRITKNELKAQIILYTASVLPLGVVVFVGHIPYLWILLALSLSVLLVHGASPFSQSFVALRFEKYGRIGTVSGILNATASIGNIMASYVFARLSEVMPWEGVTASWFAVIVICGILCRIALPRWTKFITK